MIFWTQVSNVSHNWCGALPLKHNLLCLNEMTPYFSPALWPADNTTLWMYDNHHFRYTGGWEAEGRVRERNGKRERHCSDRGEGRGRVIWLSELSPVSLCWQKDEILLWWSPAGWFLPALLPSPVCLSVSLKVTHINTLQKPQFQPILFDTCDMESGFNAFCFSLIHLNGCKLGCI